MPNAGRQCLLRAEDWLLVKFGMNRVTGVNRVFTWTKDGRITKIVAKFIDAIFLAGSTEYIKEFFK